MRPFRSPRRTHRKRTWSLIADPHLHLLAVSAQSHSSFALCALRASRAMSAVVNPFVVRSSAASSNGRPDDVRQIARHAARPRQQFVHVAADDLRNRLDLVLDRWRELVPLHLRQIGPRSSSPFPASPMSFSSRARRTNSPNFSPAMPPSPCPLFTDHFTGRSSIRATPSTDI